jgi:CDP-glucose 4,6-dehydratase
MFAGIYHKRRVLLTGHTGFKGSWLATWLLELGAEVAGFSLDVPTVPSNFEVLGLEERLNHFEGDVREFDQIARTVEVFDPEIIFHLAAQSLVRRSYDEPTLTFATNALGSLNILECIRQRPRKCVAVIITSDKCYRNQEWTWGYRENDILGGDDPYSASKACAELIFHSYAQSYFRNAHDAWVVSTRAGNVIGGGDWASDRIVPDCIRAWSVDLPARIRHPQATRPWQHVLEPLSGYLWLGACLWLEDVALRGESFNFGPAVEVSQSVGDLVSDMAKYWPEAEWRVEPTPGAKQRESTLLKLCCDKALHRLDWQSTLSLAETVLFTIGWYRAYYINKDNTMYDLTVRQIHEYVHKAMSKGLKWALQR